MTNTELKIEANGQVFPVSLDETDGQFSVNMGVLDGSSVIVRASSFAELQRKASKIKTRFALDFTQLSSDRVRNGTVTGIHASNGNLLIRWADGSTEQVPGWQGSGVVMPRLSDEEAAELARLVQARRDANHAVNAFMVPRKWDSLKEQAKKAQAEAVKAAQHE